MSAPEMTREQLAAALPEGWELLNVHHDRDTTRPSCLARHPRLGLLCAVYGSELLRGVRRAEEVDAAAAARGHELRRASLESPWASWRLGLGLWHDLEALARQLGAEARGECGACGADLAEDEGVQVCGPCGEEARHCDCERATR